MALLSGKAQAGLKQNASGVVSPLARCRGRPVGCAHTRSNLPTPCASRGALVRCLQCLHACCIDRKAIHCRSQRPSHPAPRRAACCPPCRPPRACTPGAARLGRPPRGLPPRGGRRAPDRERGDLGRRRGRAADAARPARRCRRAPAGVDDAPGRPLHEGAGRARGRLGGSGLGLCSCWRRARVWARRALRSEFDVQPRARVGHERGRQLRRRAVRGLEGAVHLVCDASR